MEFYLLFFKEIIPAIALLSQPYHLKFYFFENLGFKNMAFWFPIDLAFDKV